MSIKNNKKTKYISFMGLMLALSLILGYIDLLIPINVLGVNLKIGLANIISLFMFFRQKDIDLNIKFSHILLIVIMRVCILSVISGNMVSFILSLSGGVVSHIAMYLLPISIIPTSILAAISHNFTQILVLIAMNKNTKLTVLFLPFLIISIVTGTFTGIVAKFIPNIKMPLFK